MSRVYVPDPITDAWVGQEHGRLVARLKKQLPKFDGSRDRTVELSRTIAQLIVVERFRDMDGPDRALYHGARGQRRRLRRETWTVTTEMVSKRLALMAPGAGLALPGRQEFGSVPAVLEVVEHGRWS